MSSSEFLDVAKASSVLWPFYAAFSNGDIGSINKVFLEDWRDNTLPPNRAPGLVGLRQAIAKLRGILPDVKASVEEVLVAGDIAFVRIYFTGTNTVGLPGIPPDGKAVRFLAFDQHRFVQGKVAESWHLEDNLALLIQLGAVPPMG